MGKTIGIIEKMFNKIERGKTETWTTRGGCRVYEMFREGDKITLVHYGTVTLVYDMKNMSIVDYYGESVSDRDSMNTLLSLVGHDPNYYFRFGPVMGFVMEGPEMDEKPFDELAFIMAYEAGELPESEIIKGFQELIRSGVTWKLQGTYVRTASALIEAGLIEV
jgi:hypothetical protein